MGNDLALRRTFTALGGALGLAFLVTLVAQSCSGNPAHAQAAAEPRVFPHSAPLVDGRGRTVGRMESPSGDEALVFDREGHLQFRARRDATGAIRLLDREGRPVDMRDVEERRR